MPPLDLFLTFLAATVLFAYMPGPALLYAAAQTVGRGRRAGLMAALGMHVGGYVHVVAAAAGLAALFHAVPALYTGVKLIGAAYLVWLGLRMLRRGLRPGVATGAVAASPQRSARHAFFESVAVEVLNPKTAMFFLAFLPQFVDPGVSLPVWSQLLILGAIVNCTFSSADLVCVWFASRIVERLRRSRRMGRVMQSLGGSLLVGLGAHLALQRN